MRKRAISIVSDRVANMPGTPAGRHATLPLPRSGRCHVLAQGRGVSYRPDWGTGPVARIGSAAAFRHGSGTAIGRRPGAVACGDAWPMPQVGIRFGAQLGALLLSAFVLADCSGTQSIMDPRFGVAASP